MLIPSQIILNELIQYCDDNKCLPSYTGGNFKISKSNIIDL